jgi:DNA topoisomerase-1
VKHGKTYANVPDINELFEIGLNRAVTLIAEKRAGKGAGRGRNTIAPLKELGNHPDGEPINLFNGRFGPYLKHGTINANIPRGADPASITLEQAIELVDTRAAAAPSTKMKGKKKAAKPAAKKAEAKPTGDSKSTTKKPAAKAAAKTAKPAAKKAPGKGKTKATADEA